MAYMLTSEFQFTTPKSAVDAALDAGAAFAPIVAPIVMPNGMTDPGASDGYYLYRQFEDGAQAILNAGISSSYSPTPYTVVLGMIDALFPNSCTALRQYNRGAIIQFGFTLDQEHTWGDGDKVTTHLMGLDALDGTYSTTLVGAGFRLFCSNQFKLKGVEKLLTVKRTKNHEILLAERSVILAQAAGAFKRYVTNATHLKRLDLSQNLQDRILQAVAKKTEGAHHRRAVKEDTRLEGIMYFLAEEIANFGRNGYALLQAIQSYEYHLATANKKTHQSLLQAEVVADPEKYQRLTDTAERMLLEAAGVV